MEFGVDKCKLLICARPGKLCEVEKLLNEEPGILTFYDKPVIQVDDFMYILGFLNPLGTSPKMQLNIALLREKI